jgi:small subunit ribosomal protein S2
MAEVTLQQLLEAGCHFGHKSERWHPHASEFIYTEKDGIHIIDLAKTKAGLEAAIKYITETVAAGGDILFVATKRQAKGVVHDAVREVGAPFFTERWIGGFLTNWEEIKKNTTKANKMAADQLSGEWKKFPKHEQVKLAQYLKKLNLFYEGVLTIKRSPQALFIVDVKKEIAAVREAKRVGIPIIGIVDTNSDPKGIDFVIPANDDAVGSVKLIIDTITQAYAAAVKQRQADAAKVEESKVKVEARKTPEEKKKVEKVEVKADEVITGMDDKTKVEVEIEAKPEKPVVAEKAAAPKKAKKTVKAKNA